MTSSSQPNYNPIFAKLVSSSKEDSQERLVGMIAYADYKQDKLEWIRDNPTATDIEKEAFLKSFTDKRLKSYRKNAEDLVLSFAGEYTNEILKQRLEQEKSSQLFQEVRNNEVRLTTEIQKTKTKFWESIWQGVVSSSIFTVMLFFLGLTIRFAAPNSGIGKIIQFLASPENPKT
jgi:ATP-dependent Zn protease